MKEVSKDNNHFIAFSLFLHCLRTRNDAKVKNKQKEVLLNTLI